MKYLILPSDAEAIDRSHEAYVTDTVMKRNVAREAVEMAVADYVTQYRWGWNVGSDGQTALVIDGDEQLLTDEEQAALIDDLPDDEEGDNWYKPPSPMPSLESA